MTFVPASAGLLQPLIEPLIAAGLPGLFGLAAFVLGAYFLTRMFRPAGLAESLLFYFPFLSALICAAGYILSGLNVLNLPAAWAIAGTAMLGLAVAILVVVRKVQYVGSSTGPVLSCVSFAFSVATIDAPARWFREMRQHLKALGSAYDRVALGDKRLIMPLLVTAIVLALVNFDLARNVAPMNWDSMTYHLARMANYLQHGNLNYYDANYWAQVTHPKNSAILALFTYLSANRNENLIQLVQFVAYGIAAVSIYGICRQLGRNRFTSLFAACVFALLIECLMESNTTQNDMLLTAFVGTATYGLLAFRASRNRKYLLLTALSMALGLGMKSSALLVGPSLLVVALYALIPKEWEVRIRTVLVALRHARADGSLRQALIDTGMLTLALVVAVLCFALPAGYIDNIRQYTNPIGTEYVRKLHAFEGKPISYVLENGTLNVLRFGMEFLSFDGLPPGGFFTDAQTWIRQWPRKVYEGLGIDLQTTEATRAPFQYDKVPSAHEDVSYWGILGFALILPIVGLSLAGIIRAPGNWPLAAATVLFVLAQAYSGPYDPWRGRYFIIMAIFAVPAIACCARSSLLPWRVYLTAVVLLGCLSALTGVLGRWNDAPEEVYTMNRLQQLTRNRRNMTEPIRLFEYIVPPDATVAVAFGEDEFEYPLFGEHLTRKLIPINSFLKGPEPIPPEANYLIYNEKAYPNWKYKDIELGENWYLRILKRNQ